MTLTEKKILDEVIGAFKNIPPPKETYIVIARNQGRRNFIKKLMWQLKELRLIDDKRRSENS